MLKHCSDGNSDHEVRDVRKPASEGEICLYAADVDRRPPAVSKSRN